MENKLTAMMKAIKDLRRMNTASTLYIADMLEKDYLPKEREQIEEAVDKTMWDWKQHIREGKELQIRNGSDYFNKTYQQ